MSKAFFFSLALHRRYDEAKTKLKASGLGDSKKLSFALLGFAVACHPTRVYRSLPEFTMSIFAIAVLDASVCLNLLDASAAKQGLKS